MKMLRETCQILKLRNNNLPVHFTVAPGAIHAEVSHSQNLPSKFVEQMHCPHLHDPLSSQIELSLFLKSKT